MLRQQETTNQFDEFCTTDAGNKAENGADRDINISKTHERQSTFSASNSSDYGQIEIRFQDWGFKIDRLFEVAYRFYKRNESKAFHPSFDERNKLNALIMQARYGNHDEGRAPDIGVLDIVGKRRQYEWSLLKGMSKAEAMSKFIYTLDEICPLFKAYAEAIKLSSGLDFNEQSNSKADEDKSRTRLSLQHSENEMYNIYLSLCKQSYNQFRGYAEKQYPNDLVKQKNLISSLQEQYYQQYISQTNRESKPIVTNDSHMSINSMTVSSRSSLTSVNCISTNSMAPRDTLENLEVHMARDKTNHEDAIQNPRVSCYANQTDFYKPPLSSDLNDITCEEDNIQADISCEELHSDPIEKQTTANSNVPTDQLSLRLQSIAISNIDPIDNEKSQPEPTVEPIRLNQHSEFPPIGMFESFPEPKPLRASYQKSAPPDTIDPNPIPTVSELSESDGKQAQITKEAVPETQSPLKDLAIDGSVPSYMKSAMQTHDGSSNDGSVRHANQQHDYLLDEFHSYPEHEIVHRGDEHQTQDQDDQVPVSTNTPPNVNYNLNGAPEFWDEPSNDHPPHEPILFDNLEPATIWSKQGVNEFKESLGQDRQGGVYEVKEGTLVVIQVPTYPDGKYIYWEFATDDYDIGFGVDFVYDQNIIEPFALQIYEELGDEDLEDLVEEDGWSTSKHEHYDHESYTTEQLTNSGKSNDSERDRLFMERKRCLANTVSIVPTYRRDSHEEVFAGRHKYPGRGYYLLKFDNTYSVLRAKTLHFRVCYFV